MAQFLRSGIFLRNLAALAAFAVLGIFLLQLVLRFYTRHNESVQVHDYVGMSLNEAIAKARSRNFRIVVTDSIFKVDARPNMVLEQSPAPLSRVKERRRIYLTVTKATPDMVALPDMVGSYNYDQYSRKLAWVNVRSKVRERKFDEKLEENTILHFFYEGKQYTERDVRNGLKVPMAPRSNLLLQSDLPAWWPCPIWCAKLMRRLCSSSLRSTSTSAPYTATDRAAISSTSGNRNRLLHPASHSRRAAR
ncbi:MAG TPA: PASTA domain-containing protein [Saprospiraceae bacterium]|nr:PASTA domain-containing protein [Saprospiraceae bacterium]